MESFFAPFKHLPKGVFRLMIVGSFIVSISAGAYRDSIDTERYGKTSDTEILYALFLGFVIYWLVVRVGIWVYLGFRDDNNKA